MPKNKLIDLNNLLFEQLERMSDEDLTPEEFEREIARSTAMTKIGRIIVDNAQVALEAQKHMDEYGIDNKEMPQLLQNPGDSNGNK